MPWQSPQLRSSPGRRPNMQTRTCSPCQRAHLLRKLHRLQTTNASLAQTLIREGAVTGVMAHLRCSQQMSGVTLILIMIMRDPCTLCRAQSSCSCIGGQLWASID